MRCNNNLCCLSLQEVLRYGLFRKNRHLLLSPIYLVFQQKEFIAHAFASALRQETRFFRDQRK